MGGLLAGLARCLNKAQRQAVVVVSRKLIADFLAVNFLVIS